ncbi:hypothetical protein [Streptomyces sp. BP-8]|uniref:Uncharacterized protein n=1 Tax=Streptomyces sirii TaxID=3127701 RepID=A0ABZ2QEX0_9ACTN
MIFITVGDIGVFVRVVRGVMAHRTRAVMAPPAFCRVPEWLLGELVTEFDTIIHLPHVTGAEPDHAAVASAPHDVQEAFSPLKPE